MFDTSLIAYGIIRYKYNNRSIWGIPLFLFFASLSHGIYDFWLIYEGTKSGGFIFSIIYFFFTISLFAVILNNALNNSGFFTYKKVINPGIVAGKMIIYYLIVFLAQFILLIFVEDVSYAFGNLCISLVTTGFIIILTVVRLSRFKLIKGYWENLKLEFPFSITSGNYQDATGTRLKLSVKGDSYNEASINVYYEEYFYLNPVTKGRTYIRYSRIAFIESKFYYKNKDLYYIAKVFYNDDKNEFERMLLKPKTSGKMKINNKYPIVALMRIKNIENYEDIKINPKEARFVEWAYIKPKIDK